MCITLLNVLLEFTGLPTRGGEVVVYVNKDINQPELANSFLVCSCVCFCLYGPFNSISFHKFSRQLCAFSLCSFGLNSALLALSTIYLFTKDSLSPDVILCGLLGLKHQLINQITNHSGGAVAVRQRQR